MVEQVDLAWKRSQTMEKSPQRKKGFLAASVANGGPDDPVALYSTERRTLH